MKPRIGQTVWMLFVESGKWFIERQTVGYLGRSGFIIEGYEYKTPSWWGYDWFGHSWFSTVKEAKAYAQSRSDAPLRWFHTLADYYYSDMNPALGSGE